MAVTPQPSSATLTVSSKGRGPRSRDEGQSQEKNPPHAKSYRLPIHLTAMLHQTVRWRMHHHQTPLQQNNLPPHQSLQFVPHPKQDPLRQRSLPRRQPVQCCHLRSRLPLHHHHWTDRKRLYHHWTERRRLYYYWMDRKMLNHHWTDRKICDLLHQRMCCLCPLVSHHRRHSNHQNASALITLQCQSSGPRT